MMQRRSVLHAVCSNPHPTAVRMAAIILDADPGLGMEPDALGQTPLHTACRRIVPNEIELLDNCVAGQVLHELVQVLASEVEDLALIMLAGSFFFFRRVT
eukprot:1754382-Rhodomonas_salina.1